ncbi:MAG: hypothetical protein Q7R47_06435 [Candidatus Diapherotrites archaeon]|nr:hypothetical protein [Candidatus Diapherotrites archaeon]
MFLIALLVLIPAATSRTISQHSIQIEVSDSGQGHVIEQYFLSFNSSRELEQTRADALRLGADLSAWRTFDAGIYAHIGSIKPGTGKIGFEEKEGDRYVKIEYDTQKPLFAMDETPRRITYRLDSGQFAAFQTGSVYTFPTNTKIILVLPRTARVDTDHLSPKPETGADPTRFVWSGYLNTTGAIEFGFWIEKQIAPSVALSQTLQQFVATKEFNYVLGLVLLCLGAVYFKRRTIREKVERYLIENSSADKYKEREPIDLE